MIRSVSEPIAVSIMVGGPFRSRSFRQRTRPSSPGIMRSSTTRSNRPASSAFIISRPLAACETRNPCSLRNLTTRARNGRSSSTMRIWDVLLTSKTVSDASLGITPAIYRRRGGSEADNVTECFSHSGAAPLAEAQGRALKRPCNAHDILSKCVTSSGRLYSNGRLIPIMPTGFGLLVLPNHQSCIQAIPLDIDRYSWKHTAIEPPGIPSRIKSCGADNGATMSTTGYLVGGSSLSQRDWRSSSRAPALA